ncbi:MAG: hypothetical protein NZ523_14840, partial [Elioraea sp.]|nr:hypothetical protein [Elioraea sp.]
QCAEGEILAPWRENTDEASAAQAIARWRLDEGYSQWWEEFARDPSHMERNGYGAADLAAASRGCVPTGGCGVSLVGPVPAARIVEAEGIRRPTGPAQG